MLRSRSSALAACRAVLFAQLVDDPSSDLENFPTPEAQEVERKRLFGLGALQSSHALVPGGIYSAEATARTYARLEEVARIALGAAMVAADGDLRQ